MKVEVKFGCLAQGFRGIVLDRTPVKQRDGKLKEQYVVALCTPFEIKDEVKAFCKERGGNWLPYPQKYWYVPILPKEKNLNSFMEAAWEIINAANTAFGTHLRMGSETILISVELRIAQEKRVEICKWMNAKVDEINGVPKPAPDAAVLGGQEQVASKEPKKSVPTAPDEALRQEHAAYCEENEISKTAALKAWKLIESLSYEDLERSKLAIKNSFSPNHRGAMLSFCLRYQEIAQLIFEAEEKAQKQLEEYLDAQRPWVALMEAARDDFELEDAESTKPDGEIIITPNHIEVHALAWNDEFKNRLPKGGKYQGKGTGTWKYPLQLRSQLEETGLPIIKYPGVE